MTARIASKLWDVHTHCLPPCYVDAIRQSNARHIDGLSMSWCQDALAWNIDAQLKHQDALGIERAFVGISSPGTHLTPGNDEAARALTRACNDWTCDAVTQHPDRLGMFASLPAPDIQGSILEAERMKKEKGVKNFVVMTNAHGIYLGDAHFDALWQCLDQMAAVVSIHPSAPCMRQSKPSSAIVPSLQSPDDSSSSSAFMLGHGNPLLASFPDPLLEFMFETARAMTTMLVSDVFGRFPNIRWIVPHAGGVFFSMFDRILSVAPLLPSAPPGVDVESLKQNMLNSCLFDLAGSPFPHQIEGLLGHLGGKRDATSTKLVYGSDFPWTTTKSAQAKLEAVQLGVKSRWTDEEHVAAILAGNARRLMDRYRLWCT